jgi:putative ABC transport system permease protein
VAILTLALGIGTTTAVFTVVNGVLLRPLPYRDPSRLVMLFYGHQGRVSPWLSPPNVRDYVGPSEAFTGASSVVPITVNMTGLGDPERLQGARVSWNYFNLLGVSMALGRAFAESDAQGDGNQVVVSDGLWRRRFGGRPDVVNSTTTLDGHDVTIVGVAPAALKFPAAAEFWQPLIFKLQQGLSVDMHVLAFGLGMTLVTSIVFGLTPALAVSRRSGERLFVSSNRPHRLHSYASA